MATTTAYGPAPADIVRCAACGHMQVAEFPAEPSSRRPTREVAEAAYVDEEAGQRATAARALDRIERHRLAGRLLRPRLLGGLPARRGGRRGWSARGVEPSRFAAGFARDDLGLDVRPARSTPPSSQPASSTPSSWAT